MFFLVRDFIKKNNDESILILVICWKKTGLLHSKISNHNIIYSSKKPRKSSPLPLKSSSRLFSLDAFKFGNNTYPQRIRRRLNSGHIFQGGGRVWKARRMGREIRHAFIHSFIPLACAERDNSSPFSGASSIPSLLYTLSFHPFPPTSLPSSLTSSCHLFLGLPLCLVLYITSWKIINKQHRV